MLVEAIDLGWRKGTRILMGILALILNTGWIGGKDEMVEKGMVGMGGDS